MATYKGKILARSPFYITAKADLGNNILTSTLKVYIWDGSIFAKPTTPTYTIDKVATASTDFKIVFEISQLIRDYFIHNGNAYIDYDWENTDAVHVEIELDVTQTPDTAPATINDYYIALDGYGYFEEGVNYTGNGVYTITNTLNIPSGQDVKIPVWVYSDGVNMVKYYTDDEFVEDIDLTGWETDSNSNSRTRYLTIGGDIPSAYETIVLGDGGIYEENACFNELYGAKTIDKIELYYDTTLLDTINVNYICEPKYTPKSVRFYAKDGMLNEIYMFKRSDTEINVNREDYNKIIGQMNQNKTWDYLYDVTHHSKQIYNITAVEKITLNSGFVQESQNDVFKQLMLSEYVWVDGKPVNITSSNLRYKTRVNDRLINYTIEFEYSNNAINNIY